MLYIQFTMYFCCSVHPEYERQSGQRRKRFLVQLSKSLANVTAKDQQQRGCMVASADRPMANRKRRCQLCPRGHDKKSAKACRVCNKALCAAHITYACPDC